MAGRGKVLRRLENSSSAKQPSGAEGTPMKLMAKYSYKANPNRPGGFKELDIKQGENVCLVSKGFADNNLWWEIQRDDGERGYAPAQYLMEVETKVTSLPWLVQNPAETAQSNTFGLPEFKPYVSAYESSKPKSEESYYCATCECGFNGPIPFRAHMSSKAHKEEVQIAQRYGTE